MAGELKEKLRLEIAHVLFIDIVGYSTRLTDEQQALVDQLNQVARSSDEFQKATATGRLMKIPTGDRKKNATTKRLAKLRPLFGSIPNLIRSTNVLAF